MIVAGVGVGPPERVRECGRLGVDRVRREADGGHDQQEGEQPWLLAHEPEALPEARSPRVANSRAAGCTRSTPTTSTRYEPALIANDAGIPSLRTESAASAGPTARARL